MGDPFMTPLRLGQRLEKIVPVHVTQENVALAVRTTHHVVKGPWVLDSQLARHSAKLPKRPTISQSYGFTPFPAPKFHRHLAETVATLGWNTNQNALQFGLPKPRENS